MSRCMCRCAVVQRCRGAEVMQRYRGSEVHSSRRIGAEVVQRCMAEVVVKMGSATRGEKDVV